MELANSVRKWCPLRVIKYYFGSCVLYEVYLISPTFRELAFYPCLGYVTDCYKNLWDFI